MTDTTTAAAIRGIDICGYLVKDPAKAIAFYRDVLGMEPTSIDEHGHGAEFELADGSTFGVWNLHDAPDTTGPFFMLAVADAKAAVARIRERGGELSDPEETPVCFMAMGRDPEGNGIIIHQRK